MKKIIKYKAVSDYDLNDFNAAINGLIKDGYIPIGGICVCWENDVEQSCFYQAMVKYE